MATHLPPNLSDILNHPFPDFAPTPSMATSSQPSDRTIPPPPAVPLSSLLNDSAELAIPPPPPAPEPRRSESRSRSRSHSRSASEHESSDHEDSEEEENRNPHHHWRPIVEDKSTPCEDEVTYINSKEEHHALDDSAWFEEQTFFPIDDAAFTTPGSGRTIWQIDHFNGTKEEPNNEEIMRSPVFHVGGYDWQIKFYPRGHNTDFLSVYLECVTMQSPEFAEYEEMDQPPFPLLNDHQDPKIKMRHSIAAQVSVVIYNPNEPRTYELKTDAHRFSKQSADYGWRYFTHREDFHFRRHGQRQALLRDDKLAFAAYVRVIKDPTGCMWEHDDDGSFENVVLSTGLRPFAGQTPLLAGILPLLHFAPFRDYLVQYEKTTVMAYELQSILHKLFTRTKSELYGKHDQLDQADAITWMRKVSRMLREECGNPAAVTELIGNLDVESGAAVRSNRLQTKDCKSIQDAINKRTTPFETPMLLTLELQRQEFDRTKRKWKKLTNKVEVEQTIRVADTWYTLCACITHCGDLQSNKHNVYVKPGEYGNWYAYEDRKVTVMTRKQAVDVHEGIEAGAATDGRRDSPFAGFHQQGVTDDEIIYAVLYVRSDMGNYAFRKSKYEAWQVPEAIRLCRPFPVQLESQQSVGGAPQGEGSDLPLRVEQERFDQELRDRQTHEDELLAEGRHATPDWPLTDEEGDVVMSDVDDDESQSAINVENLAASTYLAKIPTTPSYNHKWHVTFDCIGRDYYSGQMLGSNYHGEGHLITMGGDEYTGTFDGGQRAGYGSMVYSATGDLYEGYWENGQHHGQGKLTEAVSGNVFEGGWKDGKKHGQFVMRGTVTEEDKGVCTICYVEKINTAFYDCGHMGIGVLRMFTALAMVRGSSGDDEHMGEVIQGIGYEASD
ncbi:hypothetical protein LTR08_004418 [Meristemomyces frigidus]|nr:hypothetical protein LTR08_004418 [Meristemomyces frigidus]